MLYNLDWLKEGLTFPPATELYRLNTYCANEAYFASEHLDATTNGMYSQYAKRIARVIGNFGDFISFPVLMNYQRLLALKTADLVCGEYPVVNGKDDAQNETIKDIRETSEFDSKMFATVVDLCRYGDAVWRVYQQLDGTYTFSVWDTKDWFPIVSQDGTLTVKEHVLAWIETVVPNKYMLHVQIHTPGKYILENYDIIGMNQLVPNLRITPVYTIGKRLSSVVYNNGFPTMGVIHVRNMYVSGTVYGYDDFTPIDSIIAELMTRVAQVSAILDKHADPAMVGPASLTKVDKETGERFFQTKSYYGVNKDELKPEYIVWEGQLAAAFKHIELLLNQLYIMSEMGSALLGAGGAESGQAISGTAMRFKMTNPLAKSRRISNLLSLPAKLLFSILSGIATKEISISWQDGLPDDPKETMDIVKLASGETRLMPLKIAIQEYLQRTPKEAQSWIDQLEIIKQAEADRTKETEPDGSYKETGSPQKKSSTTGLNNFNSNNKE